jgi:hypothetical protein
MLEDLNNYRIRDGFLRDGSGNGSKILKKKVRPAGLEPATPCLEVRRSARHLKGRSKIQRS